MTSSLFFDDPLNQSDPTDPDILVQLEAAKMGAAKKKKPSFVIKIFDEKTKDLCHEAVIDPNGLLRELREQYREMREGLNTLDGDKFNSAFAETGDLLAIED